VVFDCADYLFPTSELIQIDMSAEPCDNGDAFQRCHARLPTIESSNPDLSYTYLWTNTSFMLKITKDNSNSPVKNFTNCISAIAATTESNAAIMWTNYLGNDKDIRDWDRFVTNTELINNTLKFSMCYSGTVMRCATPLHICLTQLPVQYALFRKIPNNQAPSRTGANIATTVSILSTLGAVLLVLLGVLLFVRWRRHRQRKKAAEPFEREVGPPTTRAPGRSHDDARQLVNGAVLHDEGYSVLPGEEGLLASPRLSTSLVAPRLSTSGATPRQSVSRSAAHELQTAGTLRPSQSQSTSAARAQFLQAPGAAAAGQAVRVSVSRSRGNSALREADTAASGGMSGSRSRSDAPRELRFLGLPVQRVSDASAAEPLLSALSEPLKAATAETNAEDEDEQQEGASS
jgi:hypothetical protein